MLFRREVVAALLALGLAACAGASAEPTTSGVGAAVEVATPASGTIGGVGSLPSVLPEIEVPESSTDPTPSSADPAPSSTELAAGGNRVLVIGDSILAATAKRYTNDLCEALVPLGWQVALEAEVSRTIDFARIVLDARLDEGWDVGVMFLGTNYNLDPNDYLRQLDRAVNRFDGRPVVLLTTPVFDPRQERVNDIIRSIDELYDNVSVIDWATLVGDEPELLYDGIHPTPEGREVLAGVIALQLRQAPDEPGRCLDPQFDDDSAGPVSGTTTTNPSRPRPTVPRAPTTTVRPGGATTTTTRPGGSTTTSAPPSGTTTPPTSPTTPPTSPTSPPTSSPTTPAPTAPPTTSPPPTMPPPMP
jgi:hypothetical protein